MIKFCGIEHFVGEEQKDTKWNKNHLLWSFKKGLPNLPGMLLPTLKSVVNDCHTEITDICSLTFEYTEDNSKANILMDVGVIDGPSGTLAWSYLPPANPCLMLIDQSETSWRATEQGVGIDARAVILHETGHAIGLYHDPKPGALMSAYYDPNIRHFTERDKVRLVNLYGNPTPTPTQVVINIIVDSADMVAYKLTGNPNQTMISIHNPKKLEIPGYEVKRKT